MTLYQLIFYICLLLFFPSFEFYGAIRLKGLVIIVIENLVEGRK